MIHDAAEEVAVVATIREEAEVIPEVQLEVMIHDAAEEVAVVAEADGMMTTAVEVGATQEVLREATLITSMARFFHSTAC
jgi:hypothetical protein